MRSRLAWRRDVRGTADRRHALGDLFGTAWPAALLLLAAAFDRRRDLLAVLVGVLAFFAPIVVFTNLHIVHSYYQYANGAFLLAAIGIASFARKRRAPVLGEAWSSVIPYCAKSKALVLPGGDFWPLETFADILRDPQAHLAGTRFAGVVHCTGPGSDYGPERQPMVDAFLAGRRVLADRGVCRLLAAER